MAEASSTGRLKREVGVFGAIMMGLGSMVGTGVFVSIGVAAGVAGPAVVLAIVLATLVATCNALSSAQLAASLPVSGGTYEYGHEYLTPWLGFTAGCMFLCAKTASAATAALGFAGYLLQLGHQFPAVPVAVAAVAALTAVVSMGIRRSNLANIVIVSVTLFALVLFVVAALPQSWSNGGAAWLPFFRAAGEGGSAWPGVLQATALMFVAFTGYARIATLGEEMRAPKRTIPRAISVTLVVAALLYMAVGGGWHRHHRRRRPVAGSAHGDRAARRCRQHPPRTGRRLDRRHRCRHRHVGRGPQPHAGALAGGSRHGAAA